MNICLIYLICPKWQADYFSEELPAKIRAVIRILPPLSAESLTRSLLMSALKAAFDKAVADSKNLSERPENATLLKI
jgi:hypothetical protein